MRACRARGTHDMRAVVHEAREAREHIRHKARGT